jgi:hypothetical protein
MIRAAAGVAPSQRLEIEFEDGRIAAEALSGAPPKPRSSPENQETRQTSTAPQKRGGPGQGSLF